MINNDADEWVSGWVSDSAPAEIESSSDGWVSGWDVAPKEEVLKESPGVISTVGKGLAHGGLGLAESVGTGVEYLGNRIGSETVSQAGETAKKYWGEKAQAFKPSQAIEGKNVWGNPEILKNSEFWLYNIADMVPALSASVVPGVAAYKGISAISAIPKLAKIGGAIAGGLSGGALEGTQTYNAVLEKGGTEEEAARAAELMTVGSGALNALSIGNVLSKAGTTFKGKVLKHLGSAAWEGITEGLEEPTEVFSKYFGSYLAGQPLPTDLEDQLIQSAKDALTVAPIAAVTGFGGSVLGSRTQPDIATALKTGDDQALDQELDKILSDQDQAPAPFADILDQTENLPPMEDEEYKQWEAEIQRQRQPQPQRELTPQEINQARIGMTEAIGQEIENIPETDGSEWVKMEDEANAESDYWNKTREDILKQRAPKPETKQTTQEINQQKIGMTEEIGREISDFPEVKTGYGQEQARLDTESDIFLQKLDAMQNEVNGSRTRGVTQETINQPEAIAFQADSPEWMREVQEARKKDGKPALGRSDLNTLFDKVRSGKPLTENQQDQFGYVELAANKYAGQNGEMVAQEEADDLEKRGFDLLGGRKMEVINFGQGDRVVATVDGVKDEYLVKDVDEDGKVILQDGITKRVDMNDMISVEAHKPADKITDPIESPKSFKDMNSEELIAYGKSLQEKQEAVIKQAATEKTPSLYKKETYKGKEYTSGVIIHPSTKFPGKWQATSWDEKGFSGDSTHNTKEEAIQDAIVSGNNFVGRQEFDRIVKTKEFNDGNKKTADAQKTMEDSFKKRQERIKELEPQFNSILKLAADAPEYLRPVDVDRVMDAAEDQGISDEFKSWLSGQDGVNDRTYYAIFKWKPAGKPTDAGKMVEGGTPAPTPNNSNQLPDVPEADFGKSDITTPSGKPFTSKGSTIFALKRAKADKTHEAVKVEGGWVGREVGKQDSQPLTIENGFHVRDTLVSKDVFNSLPEEKRKAILDIKKEYDSLGYIDVRTQVGPDQSRRMTDKQRGDIGKTSQRVFQLEGDIKQLLKSESQISSEDKATKLEKLEGRKLQLTRYIEDLKSIYGKKLASPRDNSTKQNLEAQMDGLDAVNQEIEILKNGRPSIREALGNANTKITSEDGRAYILEDLAASIYKAGMSIKEFSGKVAEKLGKAYEKVKEAVVKIYNAINAHLDKITLGPEVGAIDLSKNKSDGPKETENIQADKKEVKQTSEKAEQPQTKQKENQDKDRINTFKKWVKENLPGFKGDLGKLKYGYDTARTGMEAFDLSDDSTLKDWAVYNNIDMLAPGKKIRSAIEERSGAIPEHVDAIQKEMLRISKTAKDQKIADEKYFTPIRRLIAMSRKTVKDVDEYLYARHASEANARLRLTNARLQLKKLIQLREDSEINQEVKAARAGFKIARARLLTTEKGTPEHKAAVEQVKTAKEALDQTKAQNVGSNLEREMAVIDAMFEKDPFGTRQELYLTLLERELKNPLNENEEKFKARWEEFKKKPSGMTDKESAELNDKYKDNKIFQKIAVIFDRMNQDKLDILRASGRISKEEYAGLKSTFQYYAPLHREGYDSRPGRGRGISAIGKDFKTRGGSTKRAVDILAHAFADYEASLIKTHKTEVARAFLQMVRNYPNENVWQIETVKKIPGYDDSGNLVEHTDMSEQDNEIKVKIDGKVYSIVANNIHSERLIKALKNDTLNTGVIVQGLAKINRVLAMVNTSLSPEFMVTNFLRDFQTAMVNVSDTEVAKYRKQVIKDIPKAMKGMHSFWRGDKSHDWAKVADQFEKAGGKIGWMDFEGDIKTRVKNLEKEINLFREGHVTQKAFSKLAKAIEDYNGIVENAVRLSVFKAGVDAGMTESKAALLAKDLTVNFQQRGIYGQLMNSLYLFANAGIQGSAKIVSVLYRSPNARKIVGASMLAAMALSMANRGIGGDDDDGIPHYDKVDDFVKERNIIFMRPGGKYFKIPLPWGYNAFWTVGTEFGDMFSKKDYNLTDSLGNILSSISGAFNPLQSSTILQTMAPTIMDPFVQVGENKTWSGSPLMPENSAFAKVKKPDSELYWASARKPSVWLSSQLNSIFGGNAVKSSGATDISPETLDLVWDTFTGSAGRFVADTASLPFKMVDGELTPATAPFSRRIMGQKSEYSDTTIYRENIDKVFERVEEIEVYPENKRLKEDKIYTLNNAAKQSEKHISKLNKLLKKSTTEEQRKRYKELINKERMNFNSKYYKLLTEKGN